MQKSAYQPRQLAKVLVGSRLHETNRPDSDYDYRGIYMDSLTDALSPFRNHKTTSWIEGDVDNTSYELREFCKLATKGNATILEVFFSDKIVTTSKAHKFMQQNWQKFMDTHHFINASRGYAHNQYKKALSYGDLGERQQIRTAKFVISFLRVMWQCEQYLYKDVFKCSLKECPYYDFITEIKGKPREEMDIPLCFAKMEQLDKELLKAEEWCKQNAPLVYYRKPDIKFIENFLNVVYLSPDEWSEEQKGNYNE